MKKNYIIKAIAAALVLAFVLNIAACSNSGDSGGDTSSLVSETDVASVESDDDEEIELTAATFDAIEASSYANWDGTVGYPEWAFDGDTATAWQDGIESTTDDADEYGVGEWLKLYNSEGTAGYLNSVTICNGYQDESNNTGSKDYYELNSRVKGFSLTFDDGTSVEFELEDVKDAQTFSFEVVETASVTFTILSVYEGQWSDTCVSEISYGLNGETIAVALEDSSDDDTATTSTTATTTKVGATTTTKKSSTTTTKKSSATTTTKKSSTTTTTKQSGTAVTIDLGSGNSTTVYVTYYQSKAKDLRTLINNFRTGNNAWLWQSDGTIYKYNQADTVSLGTLAWDSKLESVAKQRAAELAYSYSHTRPNGQSDAALAASYGYSGTVITEDIGYGSSSAQVMFDAFAEEDADYSGQGHRSDLLRPSATKVGIACALCGNRYYWVIVTGF